jgi:hypothetical protein
VEASKTKTGVQIVCQKKLFTKPQLATHRYAGLGNAR